MKVTTIYYSRAFHGVPYATFLSHDSQAEADTLAWRYHQHLEARIR